MKPLSLSLFLLLISFHSFSQKKKEEEIFTAVEQQAEFPGGMSAFGKYLLKNMKWESGENEERPSKLSIQFVVEKDGTISNFSVETPSKKLDNKIKINLEKVLSKIKWKPGKQIGKPVRSIFTIPISCLNFAE
jgi:periplasmic protein TonB